ncbi:penicillin-binding protein 1A [Desulfolithobacter sp.]
MKRQKKTSKRPARRPVLDHTHITYFLMGTCGLVTLLVGFGLAWFLSLDIPDIRTVDDYRPLVTTTLLDRHGRPVDTIYRENRIVLTWDQMPPLLPQAFVAAEDSRYWQHGGLDVWSIARAFINNLRSGRRSQGGSTITQQVTRSLMLSREKSYFRKVTEAILAYRLDRMLSKQEILTLYLNEIYLGEGAYGVEAASRTYFGKPASSLRLGEMALLAGLPQAPSRYSPLKHFSRARARQRYVLNRMAEDGLISAREARQAFNEKITFQPSGKLQRATNGYFTDYVRSQLEQLYGREQLYRAGLTVWTTLDIELQERAILAIRAGCDAIWKREDTPQPPQGALVALDNRTGRILALVGGTDYEKSPYNRAVLANRQPGSIFKPLVYAAAFERGISPDLQLNDAPLVIRNRDGSVWAPKNYSNTWHGPTTLREALIQSRNIVTIKLLRKVGVKPVIALAKKAGISSELRPELPLALGASPVSLLEMTGAYTVFASQGIYREPFAITRIQDRFGRTVPWKKGNPRTVLRPDTARTMTSILQEVINRGTGRLARGIPGAAGKTGTSDRNMDAWFIGYTKDITTGVWLGHDRSRSLGRSETGGRAAAPVWKEFMQQKRNP